MRVSYIYECFYPFIVATHETQWEKSPNKQSVGVRFFVNSALKIKNTLLRTAFSAILPTGKYIP